MQNLDKTDLSGLESQIDTLLHNINQLRHKNSSLRNTVLRLETEVETLTTKNQHASSEINRIITQLKEEME